MALLEQLVPALTALCRNWLLAMIRSRPPRRFGTNTLLCYRNALSLSWPGPNFQFSRGTRITTKGSWWVWKEGLLFSPEQRGKEESDQGRCWEILAFCQCAWTVLILWIVDSFWDFLCFWTNWKHSNSVGSVILSFAGNPPCLSVPTLPHKPASHKSLGEVSAK